MKRLFVIFLFEVAIFASVFVIGSTYHPIVRDKVFSNFIEAETVKFRGRITNFHDGCTSDDDCMIEVNNEYWVTIVRGGLRPTFVDPQPAGKVEGLDVKRLDASLNRRVEVYAQKIDESTLSIFGDEGYYVRVID